MEARYTVPLRTRLLRPVLRAVFRLVYRLVARVRIFGLENIPEQGPYIIASNHVSLFEPPFVLSFWPVAPEAAGAAEIWEKPGQNILVSYYGTIQVHRGEYDRVLMDKMVSAVRTGFPLLLFPEGGRTHVPQLRRGMPGIAYVIDKVNVPVVPVGVVGTTDDFLRRALRAERPIIEMHIGAPVTLPPIEGKGEERRAARQRNADLVMKAIAAQLPAENRGIYG